MHLFAMAQLAGHALGGCWISTGSAEPVVAYAFIRRDIDEDYTPVQWIKEMTPIILQRCYRLRYSFILRELCSPGIVARRLSGNHLLITIISVHKVS